MKTKKHIISLVAILFFFVYTGCEKQLIDDTPGDPIPIDLTLKERSLAETSNQFSFDIFNLIVENETGSENIMISPMSISYALSMTLNGAAGETKTAMLNALRYNGISLDEINNSYKSLSDKITSIDKRVVMTIANSVWVEDRLDVKEEFINALYNYFDAEGRQFNIADPGIIDEINTWISENTNGKIENMIDDIPSDVVMLLINAIYFNGKWRYQFDKSDTENKPFYLADGNNVEVDMMTIETSYKVYGNEDLIIAELPYGQGNFVMDVILPVEDNTRADILAQLTAENWASWLDSMTEREVILKMPRFKYEYKTELNDVLSSMGMGVAFTNNADFSNIANTGLAISKVLHQTFIDNKEEGTEAAAATVVMIRLTSVPDGPEIINLNRPFYYIIRETSTGTILFMGLTGNPAV